MKKLTTSILLTILSLTGFSQVLESVHSFKEFKGPLNSSIDINIIFSPEQDTQMHFRLEYYDVVYKETGSIDLYLLDDIKSLSSDITDLLAALDNNKNVVDYSAYIKHRGKYFLSGKWSIELRSDGKTFISDGGIVQLRTAKVSDIILLNAFLKKYISNFN